MNNAPGLEEVYKVQLGKGSDGPQESTWQWMYMDVRYFVH